MRDAHEEIEKNPEFKEWLSRTQPDWELEYSGHWLEQLDAWNAGYAAGRKSAVAEWKKP